MGSMSHVRRFKLSALPGPRSLPLVGSALSLTDSSRFTEVVERWGKKYGMPCKVNLLGQTFILTDNEALIRKLLEGRPKSVRRAKVMKALFDSIDMGPGLFIAEGEAWKRARRATTRVFGQHNLVTAERIIRNEVGHQMADIESQCAAGISIDWANQFKNYSLRVITKLMFGERLIDDPVQGDPFLKNTSSVFALLAKRQSMPLPYWRIFKTLSDKQGEASLNALKSGIQAQIRRVQLELADKPETYKNETLLEGLILDARYGNPLTDHEILANAVTYIAAGEDTTSSTLGWVLWYLAKHPDIQANVRAELRAQVNDSGELPALQGFNMLPNLEAAIWETLRLRTPTPLTVLTLLEELIHDGVRYPVGTTFATMLRASEQNQPEYRAGFDPSFWLEGKNLHTAIKQLPLPFGAGPRLCPGRNLSMMEMKAFLSRLLLTYQFDAVGCNEPKEKSVFTLTLDRCVLNMHPLQA